MHRFFTLLLISLTFLSCAKDYPDTFPNRITTEKTEEHVRIKGTRIFAKIPKEYTYIENLSRYQKAENLYIQFTEANNTNFTKVKSGFNKETIEAKGATVDILKDVQFNNLDAIFGDGPSKNPQERKILFTFGDDTFAALIGAVYPVDDLEAREEILSIFKSFVYQKDFGLDSYELANFEFDQSITGFKHAQTLSNLFVFNKEGDPAAENDFSNSINISSMPKMSSEDGISFIQSIIRNAENAGKKISPSEIKKTQIGSYPAAVLNTEITIDNRKGILYVALLHGKNSSVVFMGTAFRDATTLLVKYILTAETIRIK
jgi:hypothetical protein